MNLFKLQCPSCGETRARHRIAPSRYSPVAPMVVGGILMALVFEVSRKPQFRCEKCGVPFDLFHSASIFVDDASFSWVQSGSREP